MTTTLPALFDRPVVFFDLETTGRAAESCKIIDLFALRIERGQEDRVLGIRVNPGQPIPADSTAIHHIRDENVALCAPFHAHARKVFDFFDACDLAGFNITGFDVQVLERELAACGFRDALKGRRCFDAYVIFKRKHPHTLSNALSYYCNGTHRDAHDAAADVAAAMQVLTSQVCMYEDIAGSADALSEFCSRMHAACIDRSGKFVFDNRVAVINFGKSKGMPLRDLAAANPGYLRWICNGEFPSDTKEIAGNALKGVFPEYVEPARPSGKPAELDEDSILF